MVGLSAAGEDPYKLYFMSKKAEKHTITINTLLTNPIDFEEKHAFQQYFPFQSCIFKNYFIITMTIDCKDVNLDFVTGCDHVYFCSSLGGEGTMSSVERTV